jgi:tetratricopeptide (TPR) repeat protein
VAAFMAARQTPEDLTKARELFTDAIKEDPKYGKAAYNLAMACQLLSDSKCTMEAFRRAIDSDATDVESRIQYAGALIESGDPDEAIRQLTEALRLDPRADVALSHLARAYLDKEVWDRTIQLADQAIAVKPQNDQAYLWKADALRRRAAGEKDPAVKKATYAQAIETYRTYLRLTNFSTPAYESFAFHFIGFGLGSRRHADRQIVYAYQRSLAFMGLCECENKLGYSQRASEYCQRAIDYDSKEPTAYFLLANTYRDLFNQTVSREYLVRARDNYAHTIRLNPDLDLSRNAKHYIEQIDQILPKLPK